jgi:glycosyltransferase involved in cell wall biosynthesis
MRQHAILPLSSHPRPLRIGYLSHYAENTLDPLSWSGILFSIQRQLGQDGFEVVHLGKAKHLAPWQRQFYKYLNKCWQALPWPHRSPSSQRRQFIKAVESKLQQQPCDVILAPVAAAEVALLQTQVPIIYLSDATAKIYYPLYRRGVLWDFARSVESEHHAYDRAAQVIFSSDWAARSAIAEYGIDPAKVHVIPFGANLTHLPSRQQVMQQRFAAAALPAVDNCKLMFCAVHWERKGGAIAYATLLALLEMGINAELIVVGCKPPQGLHHARMRQVGFLDKGSRADCQKLEQLFLESHFFLLPTRADCSPIVFCEASAFGLPTMTAAIGGVAEVILTGRNGYVLPYDAPGEDYAARIQQLVQNPDQYRDLVIASRHEYEQRLNWGHWGQCFQQVLGQLFEETPGLGAGPFVIEQNSYSR